MAERTVKQVIVVRHDLQMNKGKFAVQAAHASLAAAKKASDDWLVAWDEEGSCKICLQANDLVHLFEINNAAKKTGLPVALITDAGVTCFEGKPVTTCLAIGPADAKEIDKITG